MVLCSVQNNCSSPFLGLGYVLYTCMFLYKKVLIKRVYIFWTTVLCRLTDCLLRANLWFSVVSYVIGNFYKKKSHNMDTIKWLHCLNVTAISLIIIIIIMWSLLLLLLLLLLLKVSLLWWWFLIFLSNFKPFIWFINFSYYYYIIIIIIIIVVVVPVAIIIIFIYILLSVQILLFYANYT